MHYGLSQTDRAKSCKTIRVLVLGMCLFSFAMRAMDCSNLPTSFTGDEFPTGDFFSNFDNPCYTIRLGQGDGQNGLAGDLNSLYNLLYFKVDPRYQLIVLGTFPNTRYFSITLYDEHNALSQTIQDTNIVPLKPGYVNPLQPGMVFMDGQKYGVPIDFGGSPGQIQPGCSTEQFNVTANRLDATQRHQGMDWNTDSRLFDQYPAFPYHTVDTPRHTNPNGGGALMIRLYLNITQLTYKTEAHVIVRDVASGCAYPAAYALNTLQIVSRNAQWLDDSQEERHTYYENQFLPKLCYAASVESRLSWSRGGEFVDVFGNPDAGYLRAITPAGLPDNLAAAGRVMRVRLRIPTTPPTPCAGCTRSGAEQLRYMSLSFQAAKGVTLASVADKAFTKDPNGYAVLIVGTGAAIPSWITTGNGYTKLDLKSVTGYQQLNGIFIRNILPAPSFGCSGLIVPYNTGISTPSGALIGDYLPVVDYPVAANLPKVASPLVGPNSCGAFPAGLPAVNPTCEVLPYNKLAIDRIVTQCASPGCNAVAAQSRPPLTILGSGFGVFPSGLPYSGQSSYLQIIDSTGGWSAGYTGDTCNVLIDNWTDGRISLVVDENQDDHCSIAAGDQVTVKVWNPQAMGAPAQTTVVATPD